MYCPFSTFTVTVTYYATLMTVVVPVVVPLVSSSLSESLLRARSVLPVGEAYSENTITDLFFPITILLFPHYARCLFVPQNYAGIIHPTLIASDTNVSFKQLCSRVAAITGPWNCVVYRDIRGFSGNCVGDAASSGCGFVRHTRLSAQCVCLVSILKLISI